MKGSFRFRRVGKAAAACTLSLMLVFPTPAVAFAATSTELQQQIATVRETLDGYYSEAEMCQNDLVTVRQQLKETEAKISELNKQIPVTESSFKDAQSRLAQHVSETYKNGNPSLLDVILQSASFEDLVSRITYANKIAERGNMLVEEAKGLYDTLSRQKSDLETAQASLSSLEDEQENRLQALNAAAEELENYQGQLSEELKAQLAAEDAEKRRKAEEAAAAAAAEAQRIADEEAAAKKAAEQQRKQQEAQQQQQQEQQAQQPEQQQPEAQPEQQQPEAQPEQQQPEAQPDQPAASETPETPTQNEQTPQEPEVPSEPENSNEETQQNTSTQDDDSDDVDDNEGYEESSSSTNSYSYGASASSLVARAYSIIGSAYSYSGYNWTGSTSTSSFTCSGVVDYALGLPSWSNSPETLYAQVGSNLVTDTSQLNYGDLVFYSYASRYPGHVGIYIGDGSIIDSIPNGGVQIRDVNYMPCMGGGPIV